MNTGPKLNAFLAVCGVAAAGLGVVSAGLPFLQKGAAEKPAAAVASAKPEEADARACTDGEREAARAALYNYGRHTVESCFMFSKEHEAVLDSCEVDRVTRRINARGVYDWKGGVRAKPHQFTASFSTDLVGTDIRVNITARTRESDEDCR
ncbi:MAG: hypothetical protein AB7M12_00290 [Hyphomonadaceae bacterium]